MAKKRNIKEEGGQGKNYSQYLVPLIIIIAALIIFNPSMKNGVLHGWDDTEYMNDQGVQDFDLAMIFSEYHLGMYQPLAVLSMAMNYASAEEGPKAYHATNMFLHVLNIVLVWLLLLRLSRRRIIAGAGALLFAIHPLNVEPVAWIAARSTLLFTAFYLGGLLTYLKYIENRKALFFVATLLLALAAFFSKSLAMSFPLALLVIDYWRERGWSVRVLAEKLPFLAFSVVFGIVTVNAAEAYGHITELQHDYSLIERFFILCHTYVFYLVKFLVPVNLSPIYAYPDLSSGSLSLWHYLSPVIPLALLYLVYKYRNRQRGLIAGLLFFTFAILPVLPLFWSRVFVAADRYAYLSFIGLYLVAGILVSELFSLKAMRRKTIPYIAAGILLVYAAFLGYQSNRQCRYWSSADMLLSRAVILSNNSTAKALSYFYRGNAKQNIAEKKHLEGQLSRNEGMVRNAFIYYGDAIRDYDSVLVHNPGHMLAYGNRGMIYGTLANYDRKYLEQAEQDFEKAIAIDPEYADNYYNKAWVDLVKGDTAAACALWHKADELGSVVAYQAIAKHCR